MTNEETPVAKKSFASKLPSVVKRRPPDLDLSDPKRTVLQVYDDFSFLRCSDESLLRIMYNAFRFREANYFHSPLYRAGKWDGYTEFFSNRTGRFCTGLLGTMELGLKRLARQYEVQDHRSTMPEEIKKTVTEDDLKRLGFVDMKRAYYQVPGANLALTEQRGIIQAATGAGKSAIMMLVLERLSECKIPTLITTKGKLIKQLYRETSERGIDCGLVSGDTFEPKMITFCNVESVHKIGQLLKHFRALIVDEVHMFANDTGILLFERLPNCPMRIGFSATPWKKGTSGRVHNFKLKSWFGQELMAIPIDELMDNGILAEAEANFHLIDSPHACTGDYTTDYRLGVIENPKVTEKIVELCRSTVGRKLVCVQSIEHGQRVHDSLQGAGENVHLIWGDTSDEVRDSFYELLRRSPDNITVVGSSILQTGIDVWIHMLINARGLKAEHSTEQLFGRGTRKASDKEKLAYHDFWYTDTVSPYLHRHSRTRRKLISAFKVPINFVGFDPH